MHFQFIQSIYMCTKYLEIIYCNMSQFIKIHLVSQNIQIKFILNLLFWNLKENWWKNSINMEKKSHLSNFFHLLGLQSLISVTSQCTPIAIITTMYPNSYNNNPTLRCNIVLYRLYDGKYYYDVEFLTYFNHMICVLPVVLIQHDHACTLFKPKTQ